MTARGLLFIGTALVLTSAAQAQNVPVAPATTSTDADGGEIVVSARKRAESIVDVPTAVTALTSADLSTRGIVDFAGLNQFVPGFRWNPSGSSNTARTFNTFVIRGTYSGSDHPDRQNVSLFIDGIPIGGAGSLPGLTDVRQVEVVKGPQSAYFGRSTFGGAVNFITTAPGNDYKVSGSVDLATYANREIGISLEGPIVPDLLAIRVSGRHYHAGSQYDNFGYGGELGERQTNSVSGTVSFTPAPNFSMRGYFTYWRDKDAPFATSLLTSADYNCNAGAGVAGALNYVCGSIGRAPANRISQNTAVGSAITDQLASRNQTLGSDFIDDFGFRRRAHFGYISAQYEMGNKWTVSLNGSTGDNRYAVLADNANRYLTNNTYSVTLTPWHIENKSAELRLATDVSKPLKVVVGSNYFQQISHTGSNTARTGGAIVTGLPFQKGSANTYGLFGSISYDITDALSLSAEGRYQKDKIRSQVLSTGGIDISGTTNSFTPRLIAQYKLARNANIYASYSEGTRPAQFNSNVFSLSAAAKAELATQADIPLVVPEEKLKMGEFGFKGEFFDRKVRLLSALYYGQWRNKQIQQTLQYHPTPTTLTSLLVFLPNGRVNIYGIELEGHYTPIAALSFDGTFAYAETDIRSTYCADCRSITGNPTPVGTRLPRYPAFTGSASIDFHPELNSRLTGIARLDWVYTGKQYDTEANIAYVPSSQIVNLRIGARTDTVSLEFYVKNLFNDDTPLNIGRSADTFNSSNTILLAPAQKRIIGVHSSINF
ncbi:iron complex outermembrane recepter protein [Sphingomonas sp. YR710]|uniref:TonB-dependent receptor n=1 Tax=Sphingomonas sp. YR710 TaxID=1882773 RepID=UPI00087E7147|nr:TonB-dependent receptor [Sphingomonas sp. YR710]SDC82665.1 iron complex outermembrane recepter protein [Sphingomonas sp. YR710]